MSSKEMNRRAWGIHEYRSPVAFFTALICGALAFLWISRGTQFHQLAIGLAMSAVTLSLALALFELCWRAAVWVARFLADGN